VTKPHLWAALAALLVVAVALSGGVAYAEHVEQQYLVALAPLIFEQKSLGTVLQEQAFERPDVFVLYGSSELRANGKEVAGEFFQSEPTGFVVFPIGLHGANTLIYLQELAAAGATARGKKIAISLSPGFFQLQMLTADAYAFNFSRLHAYDLAFSTELSFGVKQGAARRMLQYPQTLEGDPVLDLALESLADGSPRSLAAYWLLFPLGKLQSLILRLQDHWATLEYVYDNRAHLKTDIPSQPDSPDWAALERAGESAYAPLANNNRFGIANVYWNKSGAEWLKLKNSLTDAKYTKQLRRSLEWTDLELLLQGLNDLGVQTLVLSMPIHGRFYGFMGVSAAARQQYYDRLEAVGKKYGVTVVDFSDHDDDKYFLVDYLGHMSAKGWMYYDEALDNFYHSPLH
jgi:D-alanine transfer protein